MIVSLLNLPSFDSLKAFAKVLSDDVEHRQSLLTNVAQERFNDFIFAINEIEDKYYLSEKVAKYVLCAGTKTFKTSIKTDLDIARPLLQSMHKMHRACQDNYYSQDFIESHGTINHVEDYTKEQLAQLPIRKLTPEEAFMLQGFPIEFAINARNAGVADGSLYKQAGNAVSVNTIYAVLYYLIINNIIHE